MGARTQRKVVSPSTGVPGIGNQSWRSLIEWGEGEQKREVSASSALRVRVYGLEVSG